jgi:quinol monooxygenase YgiN
MSVEKFILLVQAQVKPEFREDVLSAAKTNFPFTIAEPGCEAFFQTTSADNPNELVFFEVFSSTEAHEVHLTQDYAEAFFAVLEGKLLSPPNIKKLNLI